MENNSSFRLMASRKYEPDHFRFAHGRHDRRFNLFADGSFFKRSHKVIVAQVVKEILDKQIAKKPV